MTSRERVLKAMRREGPDRVPFTIGFTPTAMEKFVENSGTDDVDEFFGTDVRNAGPKAPEPVDSSEYYKDREMPEGTGYGLYGVARVPGEFYHFTHTESPLAGKDSKLVYDYPMPDVTKDEDWEGVGDKIKKHQANGYAVAGFAGHVYETAWQIRGMEDFLMDMYGDPDAIKHLVGRLDAIRIFCARRLAELGVDVLFLGDDIATQNDMMMAPDMWRDLLKPGLAEAIRVAKEANPDVLTWYHSDGNCAAVIPDLVESGLDILNPVQPECLNLADLKKKFGDRLSFWGTIGTQTTMPFGTPDDVRKQVREHVEICGREGGLLLAPTHVIEPDVPYENLLALRDAIQAQGA